MRIILDEKNFNKLNETLIKVEERYSGENIFGIYTYGDFSEVVCVMVPTFEEVCLNKELIHEAFPYQGYNIDIIDVRYIYHATRDGFPQIIESLYTDYYIINPRYEHMYQKLFRANREKFKIGIKTGFPPEELKIAIMKIMRTVFNDNSAAVKFIKQLTDTEKNIIEHIINTVGDEGLFSQTKIATAAGVSKQSILNLTLKMQASGVAQIKFFGNKGTYFKIIDDTLLRIRG